MMIYFYIAVLSVFITVGVPYLAIKFWELFLKKEEQEA